MSKDEKKTDKIDNLVIENTQARLIVLPGAMHPQHGPFKKEDQRLIPGENNVPAWAWKKAKENKAVKIYIACKYLVDKGKGEAKELSKGLDGLAVNDAKAQIAKCDEIKLLNNWMSATKSPALKKACKARIDALIAAADQDKD